MQNNSLQIRFFCLHFNENVNFSKSLWLTEGSSEDWAELAFCSPGQNSEFFSFICSGADIDSLTPCGFIDTFETLSDSEESEL